MAELGRERRARARAFHPTPVGSGAPVPTRGRPWGGRGRVGCHRVRLGGVLRRARGAPGRHGPRRDGPWKEVGCEFGRTAEERRRSLLHSFIPRACACGASVSRSCSLQHPPGHPHTALLPTCTRATRARALTRPRRPQTHPKASPQASPPMQADPPPGLPPADPPPGLPPADWAELPPEMVQAIGSNLPFVAR